MLFFKYIYEPTADQWGFLGLPKGRGAESLHRYHYPSLVLLSVPKSYNHELAGKIYGACTLTGECAPSKQLIPSDVAQSEADAFCKRWPVGAVIDRHWTFQEPIESEVDGGRGQLVRLAGDEYSDLLRWAETATKKSQRVRRPPGPFEEAPISRDPRLAANYGA